MDPTAPEKSLRQLLDTHLFMLGGRVITLGTLLVSLFVLTAATLTARSLRAGIEGWLRRRGLSHSGMYQLAVRVLSWTVILFGVAVAVQTAGVDLASLFAASAVFAVGLGVAMQGVLVNFVTGVVLALERTIKPGDVLEVEGRIVRVEEIGMRATRVRTLDEEDILLPNSLLVQQPVKNLTLHDTLYRVRVTVGASYGSDLALVRRTLLEVAQRMPWREADREPLVLLDDFADSAVKYEACVWMRDPWRQRRARSELREAIWAAFQEQGIVIAFPQLDVHLDGALKASSHPGRDDEQRPSAPPA